MTRQSQSQNPFILFRLVPKNERAHEVLQNPANAHHLSPSRDGFDIGLHIASTSRYTIATIGRLGNIVIEEEEISRIHCSFEISENNEKAIMLQDRSTNQTTKFVGETAMSFRAWPAHRRVLIDQQVNMEFGLGGVACDMFQFEINWYLNPKSDLWEVVRHRQDCPLETRTLLLAPPTAVVSNSATRITTPAEGIPPQAKDLKIRYSRQQMVGRGTFGEVYEVWDVDSGDLYAVKKIKLPNTDSSEYKRLKREIKLLSGNFHNNIIKYKAAQESNGYQEIFMDLKHGTVESLIRKDVYTNDMRLSDPLYHQMLQALDFLEQIRVVHRDVKPENILYRTLPTGDYEYQLADFGLATKVDEAWTFVGTRLFMAPEFDDPRGPQKQSFKVDIWSLFITIAYALNVDGFRTKRLHNVKQRIQAAHEAAATDTLRQLARMVAVDPLRRASAGEMLDEVFHGNGRITQRTPNARPQRRELQEESHTTPIETKVPPVPRNKLGITTEQRLKVRKTRRAAEKQLLRRSAQGVRHAELKPEPGTQKRPRLGAPQFPGAYPEEPRPPERRFT